MTFTRNNQPIVRKEKIIADDTLQILKNGYYNHNNKVLELQDAIENCVKNTYTIHERDNIVSPLPVVETELEISNETTLQAASRLHLENPCVLNFANANTPGGGFKQGARAQEESITRSSALYLSIKDSEFYKIHNKNKDDLFYTDTLIYSSDVPVIKNDDGDLLNNPYKISIITSAAPMRTMLNSTYSGIGIYEPLDTALKRVIDSRIDRILKTCAAFDHDTLILGAWGCGAFGNDPYMVAESFKNKLKENPYFKKVIFAIYGNDGNYEIFKDILS